MNTVLERNTLDDVQQQQHNSMISERYRKLLDAVEDVFSAPVVEEKEQETPLFVSQAPLLNDTPAVEQTPTVTEYAPVFTTEKFARVEEFQREEELAAPIVDTQTKAVVKAAPTAVAQYSLTPFAKVAMAIFTLLVIAMLALIGVNSHLLSQRKIRLKNLEEKREELLERSEELQNYIQELQTEESILQRAEQAGLLN